MSDSNSPAADPESSDGGGCAAGQSAETPDDDAGEEAVGGFGVQVGVGFLGRVVMAVVAFAGSIVLARALGPERFGSFYLLLAVVEFLDNPVTGWAAACRKRYREVDFPAGEAMGAIFLGVIVGSACVAVAAWLAGPIVDRFTDLTDGWLLLAVLYVGMAAFLSVIGVLKATRNFGAGNWLAAGRDIVRVIAQIALVLAGFGVAGMVGGMVLANLAAVPVGLYVIGVRPTVPSRERLASIWAFARSSILTGVVSTAQNRIDIILLGVLAGSGVVGNYEVALKLTIPGMFVAGVASNGLMGRVSDRRSRGRSVAADIRNNLGYASLFAVPLFFGALTMGRPIVQTAYSSQYTQAGAFIAGLALFRLVRSQKMILVGVVDGFDRPDLNLRIATVLFLVNVLTGVGLFVLIGPIGIVIATVLSEVVAHAGLWHVVRRLSPDVTLLPRPLIEQIASGGVMALAILGVRRTIGLPGWQWVLGVVAFGGVVYFVVLTGISHEFRSAIRAVLGDAAAAWG